MFWNKIIDKISFPIAIVLVVAGVLVFSFFDPWGILSPQKVTLKDTPVTVESIQGIGQLITAEYYGEVVESLGHKLKENTRVKVDSFSEDLTDMKLDLMSVVVGARNQKLNKDKGSVYRFLQADKNSADSYYKTYQDLRKEKRYPLMIKYLELTMKGKSMSVRKFNNWMKKTTVDDIEKGAEKFVMKSMVSQMDLQREHNFRELLAAEVITKKQAKDQKHDPTSEATVQEITWFDEMNMGALGDIFLQSQNITNDEEGQLVLVGRGWVKAGFDFKEFNSQNFKYNEDKGEIHLIGLEPKLLTYTINPWFIPERKIPGFEILVADRKNKDNVATLDTVKTMCLNKLRNQALGMEILQKAQENGKIHLQNFFSLIMDKPIKVMFHNNEYSYITRTILEDGMVKDGELLVVDTLLVRSIKNWENPKVRAYALQLVDTLNQSPIYINGVKVDSTKLPYAYASMAYRILHDKKLNYHDSLLVNGLRDHLLKLDTTSLNVPALELYKEFKKELSNCEDLSGLEATLASCIADTTDEWYDPDSIKSPAECKNDFKLAKQQLLRECKATLLEDHRDSLNVKCRIFKKKIRLIQLWKRNSYRKEEWSPDLKLLLEYVNARLQKSGDRFDIDNFDQFVDDPSYQMDFTTPLKEVQNLSTDTLITTDTTNSPNVQ